MTHWMHPPELARARERDGFDPVVEGARRGLSRELSLATWERICADATDSAGRLDAEWAERRFRDIAARIEAHGGRLRPDVGRRTRVETELIGMRGAWPIDELTPAVSGRTTRVGRFSPTGQVHGHGARVDRQAAGALDDAPPSSDAIDPLARSPGQPLPTELAARLSRALGRDVSAVRIHTDDIAARVAAELRANAFTIGVDVFFAAGRYRPGSSEGERLIAHEVAHTVQQRDAPAADVLEVSSPRDGHEVEADRFADAFAARPAPPEVAAGPGALALSDDEAALLTPAGVAAIQRDPAGSGSGGGLPAVVSVKVPDVELFPRKTIKAKHWDLGSFEKTLLDKTIVIKGVPVRILCEVSGDADANLNSTYGPGKVTGIVAETETHWFTTEQKIKLAAAFVLGPGVFFPLLLYYLKTSNTVKQHAHGRFTAGIDINASVNGNLTGELSVGDPMGIVRGGGLGRLNASARGHAGFNVFSDLDFYLEDGKVSQIDADLDVAAECTLAFDLGATIGAFLEIDEEGERKRQNGGEESPPGGVGLSSPPPGWPEQDVPWKPGTPDPWTPVKWRREWTKTWPLVHKNYGWILWGSATATADRGAGSGDLDMDDKDVDMDELCNFYMHEAPDSQEPVDEPKPNPDGPTQKEVDDARTDANDSIETIRDTLKEETKWTGLELSRTENDLERSPPSAEEKPKFDAYRKALRDHLALVEKSQRATNGLPAKVALVDVKARSSKAQDRRDAISEYNAISDNCEDLKEAVKTRPERPERARLRNPFNARREGEGFTGDFADFPDWNGYPPTKGTLHPANKFTGKTKGEIPRPRGIYHVPGPETPGGMHNKVWRDELYGERDARKQVLEKEFRGKHPGQKVPDMTQQANDDIVEVYKSRGFSLTWDELDLHGFQEHHIHECGWGGPPNSAGNLIYLRTQEHQLCTNWWRGRKAEIFAALPMDDP